RARTGPKSEAVVLEKAVSGLGIWCVTGIIAAGVSVATLVAVVASQVNDRADPQWSSETDGVAKARVGIVPGLIHDEAQPTHCRSVREFVADVLIVARQVPQDSQSSEASVAGPLRQQIDIVASSIYEQTHAQPAGHQTHWSSMIGVIAGEVQHHA